MKRSHYFKIAAAGILGLTAILWFIKGITDIFGNVSGGILNLVLSIFLFGLIFLSWKRLLLGGIITASLAVLLAFGFSIVLPDISLALIPLLLLCAPMALSGLLFIEADWTKKRRD
ncbi:MAG: hypothetical protein WCE68_13470 [Anaerolineales bacterium]